MYILLLTDREHHKTIDILGHLEDNYSIKSGYMHTIYLDSLSDRRAQWVADIMWRTMLAQRTGNYKKNIINYWAGL